MVTVRLATRSDLNALEDLYTHLNPQRAHLRQETATKILDQILAGPGFYLFVCAADETLVASCMLATIPNLMRGGRPHALLENVVTHRDHRRKGYGQAVVQAALRAAWDAKAHHVLLMTGRTNPGVQKFYERCGFEANVKTGYVARSPVNSD